MRKAFLPLLALLLTGAAAPAADRPVESRRVDVAHGRALTLVCSGSGPTVLFEAGGSDWSSIWSKVQPAIAKRARACAYDRAGLGDSDPGGEPRSPVALVEDLHALARAAPLARPLVLVGHSLGGFDVKLYAALYPDDVAVPDLGRIMRPVPCCSTRRRNGPGREAATSSSANMALPWRPARS